LRPFQDQQPARHDERDECRMKQQDKIGAHAVPRHVSGPEVES
jgi:hypothetical protein